MNVLRRCGHLPYCVYRVLCKEITPASYQNVNFSCLTISKSSELSNLKPMNLSYSANRCKSVKKKDEDSDDENTVELEDDFSLSKDSKIVKLSTTSLRTDAILKSALNIARNKVEKLFYESKIRVNGKKIMKKSVPVRIDDEIDVIKGVSPKNSDHLYVARVEILSMSAKEEGIAITARRFKNLLIENYETDPYKHSTSDEE